jgi:hypothetical protein
MTRMLSVVAAAVVLGHGLVADAGQPGGHVLRFSVPACCCNPLLTGCPDDYCPKPLPRVVCPPCGLPDDYCPKPPPCLGRLPCGQCDDYCRKPWPNLCRPLSPEHYHCGKRPR